MAVVIDPSNRHDGRPHVIMREFSLDDQVSDIHLDISSLPNATRPATLFGWLRDWYYVSVLRLLIAECRSLAYRTARSLEIRAWELGGYRDSGHSRNDLLLSFESQNCKRAYIRYMQQIQTDHPFLSTFDRLLVAQAWQAGSEWDGRSCTLQTQDRCSSASPEGGDSMLPLAVQQPSAEELE